MSRTTVLALVLSGLAVAVPPPPAAASAREDGLSVVLSTAQAPSGETVRATGTGWPAGQLIQLVTCGELAVTGSAACDMRGALATSVRADGTFTVDLVLGKPPKPCPCVVHVAMVGLGADGHVDAPVDIPGHPRGPVPTQAVTVAKLEVVEARLTGGDSLSSWFGGEQERTLVYTVRNPGPGVVRGLPLNVRVGKGGGGDRAPAPEAGEIAAGETRTYEVPVVIGFAAFGRYGVHADIGGIGATSVPHDAYPWGLVAVNVLGLALVAWGVLRRLRRTRAQTAAGPQPVGGDDVLLPAVVRLPSLGATLVFDDAPGARRLRRSARGQLALPELRALLDSARAGGADGPASNAVIDLEALDQVLAQRAILNTQPREGS